MIFSSKGGSWRGVVGRNTAAMILRTAAGVWGAGLLSSCETTMRGKGGFPLQEIRPSTNIAVDLQYKTPKNITSKALYPRDFKAYATVDTALALEQAAKDLGSQGYTLVLLDAWRPPVAAALLWNEAVRRGLRDMYAPPNISGHTRGTAVDVALRLKSGEGADMPGDYDCHLTGAGVTHHSEVLSKAMRKAGFTGHRGEWWHFDHVSGGKAAVVENPWEKRGRKIVDSPE